MKIETKYSIGDEFKADDRWYCVCTALTIRASGQVEYQLEWMGDAEFKAEWLTAERLELLGLTKVEGEK